MHPYFHVSAHSTPASSLGTGHSLNSHAFSLWHGSPQCSVLHVKTNGMGWDGRPSLIFKPPPEHPPPTPRIFLCSHAHAHPPPPTPSFSSLPFLSHPHLYYIFTLCSLLRPAISNASITPPCPMKVIRQRAPSSPRKMT